ncbi:hypothetical protein FGG08_004691 [Glutinoglossum americanum]|uniref:Ubiquitin-like 1-activating enzyme E1A n=1 Tax=Glutinoglossum americanum TaxID=1670608 RepID=A0A9P8L3P2_9PEZI|nr:hypothetical protein FGG08_004691 [Glutinoglossum americanum]
MPITVDSTDEVATATENTQSISADEIALYDRQIRLWGVKAQEKLRSANILLVTMKALANEIAKNLVLAGIGSLTIIDHEPVSGDDLCSQFFLSEEDIGKNRANAAAPQIRKLNPRVAVHAESTDVKTRGPEYFTQFDVVIITEADFDTISSINTHTRLSNRPLYATASHGFYGYIFADLISHDYVIQRDKSNIPTALKAETSTRSVIAATTKKENGKVVEIVTKRETYSPIALVNSAPLPAEHLKNRRRLRQVTQLLTGIRALWEFQRLSNNALPSQSRADMELFTTLATAKHKELQLPPETLTSEFLRNFLQNMGAELAPVTAFLGGVLAQDVINVLGGREQPIQNFLLFDAEESKAPVYALHPLMSLVVA